MRRGREPIGFETKEMKRVRLHAEERARAEQAEERYPSPADDLRDCQEWRELSRVMRDERPRCERCGVTDELHVHHVEPLWKAPHRLLDVTNLRVLCSRCHATVEPMVRRPQARAVEELHPLAQEMHGRKRTTRARMVTGKRPPQPGSRLR